MNEALAKALLEAQKEMPSLVRDSTNPDFSTRYLSLEKLVEAVYPVLHKHGLFVIQAPTISDGKPALATSIVSVEGKERIESTMLLMQSRNDPQGQGSAITYARRYALMGMLGLVADEDDDGNSSRAVDRNADVETHFDPGKQRLPSAPRGDNLMQAIGEMQQAIDPTVDWKALSSALVGTLHGGRMREELTSEEFEPFLLRWVNAITRLHGVLSGDFPPLNDETIADAFKWAFGVDVVVPHVEPPA
jgi:hypothetical protein